MVLGLRTAPDCIVLRPDGLRCIALAGARHLCLVLARKLRQVFMLLARLRQTLHRFVHVLRLARCTGALYVDISRPMAARSTPQKSVRSSNPSPRASFSPSFPEDDAGNPGLTGSYRDR